MAIYPEEDLSPRLNNHFFDPLRQCFGWHDRNLRFNRWPAYKGLPTSTSGFTHERTPKCHDQLPPLDIILAFGPPALTYSICQRFAKGAQYHHLDVAEYLATLDDMDDGHEKAEALGLLHPLALRKARIRGRAIPGRLLMPILLRKVKQEVASGMRRFIVTGLEESEDAVACFQRIVAAPGAVVVFCTARSRRDGYQEEVFERLGLAGRVVEVVVNEEEDVNGAYTSLLSEIGRRAQASPHTIVSHGMDKAMQEVPAGGDITDESDEMLECRMWFGSMRVRRPAGRTRRERKAHVRAYRTHLGV